jgi:hypothetical protein
MPTADEIRKLIDHAYLRTLAGKLAETQTVIERATLACAVSNHLLGRSEGAGVELPDPDQSERVKASERTRRG